MTLIVVVESLSHAWLLYDPMDCIPPGSSVHGIFQARILEWVAIPFSRTLIILCKYWLVNCITQSWFFFFFLTLQYGIGFAISTWIRHRYTRVPHPEPSSLLPPRTIPLGHQDSMVLAQRQKYRSMEQNRKPRDQCTHLWTPYLRQRRQEYTMD